MRFFNSLWAALKRFHYDEAGGTGTAVATDDIGTAAKMNLKLETVLEADLETGHSYAADGLNEKRVARATYDFAEHGGAISTIGLGVTLPDNAIVVRAFYEVLTTLTSAGDTATIAVTIPTDDVAGIVAATAINAGGNVWDAGHHEAIQTGTAATFSEKCTAARELSVTIAVQAVTAGKFILWCEYVISD